MKKWKGCRFQTRILELSKGPEGYDVASKAIPDSIRPSYSTVVDLLIVHVWFYLYVRMISMWPHMCTVYVFLGMNVASYVCMFLTYDIYIYIHNYIHVCTYMTNIIYMAYVFPSKPWDPGCWEAIIKKYEPYLECRTYAPSGSRMSTKEVMITAVVDADSYSRFDKGPPF